VRPRISRPLKAGRTHGSAASCGIELCASASVSKEAKDCADELREEANVGNDWADEFLEEPSHVETDPIDKTFLRGTPSELSGELSGAKNLDTSFAVLP